jgi:hypothetical protein
MGVDVLHKIFVLATDGAHKGQSVKTEWSLKAGAVIFLNTIVMYAVERIDDPA